MRVIRLIIKHLFFPYKYETLRQRWIKACFDKI